MLTPHFSVLTPVNSRAKRALLVGFLVSVFLLAQCTGFFHRLAHATPAKTQVHSISSTQSGDIDLRHSCLLLDALSLAAGLVTSKKSLVPTHLHYNLGLSLASLLWLAQPQIYFLSRAPPQKIPDVP
jgi:hypothetical protein